MNQKELDLILFELKTLNYNIEKLAESLDGVHECLKVR